MKKLRTLLLWPVIAGVVVLAVLGFLGYVPFALYIAAGVFALYILVFRLKPRTSLIIVAIAAAVTGLYFLGGAIFHDDPMTVFRASLHIPKPKPETVIRFHVGSVPIDITSTAFSSFVAMAVLVILAALISRGLRRKSEEERIKNPRGWQNLVEWAVGYVIDLLEGAAGKGRLKKRPVARVIFPLVGTLFIFIIFANWFSLVPGFSTIVVKPPFDPVKEGAVSLEPAPTVAICPGDELTLTANAKGATEPEFHWYVNGEHQEGHHAWLDYEFGEEGQVLDILVEAWNEDAEGRHYSAEYGASYVVLSGEEAEEAGCGERDPAVAAAHEHEEHAAPGLIWFFGGDKPGEAVPILRAPNSHLSITAGMAVVAIVVVQALAIVAHGPVGYLRHLATDAPVWMRFIMFPIHVVSEFSRIISLSARLFGNLYGGDVLLAVIVNLIAPLVPALFFGIEAFFYYIQALLFSVLTTVYIALAVAGGHDEEHGH